MHIWMLINKPIDPIPKQHSSSSASAGVLGRHTADKQANGRVLDRLQKKTNNQLKSLLL